MIRKNIFFSGLLIILLLVSLNQKVFSWDDPAKKGISSHNTSIDVHDMAITHNRRGNEYLKAGYPLHAVNEFKIAIMLNPNSTMSATLYNNLGRSYEMVRQYELAISSYQHAIRVNPEFSRYYKNLINAYKAQRTLTKACHNYETVVKENPKDAQAWYTLGLIYYEQKKYLDAQEAFNTFIELEPNVELAIAAKKYLKKMSGE